MNQPSHKPAKKIKYLISIIYLIVLAIIVAGSYLHQQNQEAKNISNTEQDVIWPKAN